VAINDVEDAFGQAGFEGELGEEDARRRVAHIHSGIIAGKLKG
jgi:hypothetical protein